MMQFVLYLFRKPFKKYACLDTQNKISLYRKCWKYIGGAVLSLPEYKILFFFLTVPLLQNQVSSSQQLVSFLQPHIPILLCLQIISSQYICMSQQYSLQNRLILKLGLVIIVLNIWLIMPHCLALHKFCTRILYNKHKMVKGPNIEIIYFGN